MDAELVEAMRKQHEECFNRVLFDAPDSVLDERMASKGWRYNPLSREWERIAQAIRNNKP